MAGPPADISSDELWLKLAEARPSEVVDFPRRGPDGKPIGRLRIQVLRMEDHDAARLRAHAALKNKAQFIGLEKLDGADMASPAVQAVLGDLTARELLSIACLRAEPVPGTADDRPFYPQLFKDPEDLSRKIGSDEIAVLFSAYQLIQHKYGPFERTLQSKEDEDAWIARLAESLDDPLAIARLSLPQLAEVSTSLSGRLFSISSLLRSQWESLPPTLASALETFCMDTSYFGKPPAELDETGSDRSPDSEREPVGIPADRTITTEEAARLAEKLRGGGG